MVLSPIDPWPVGMVITQAKTPAVSYRPMGKQPCFSGHKHSARTLTLPHGSCRHSSHRQ